jgi:hypothetical protein
VAGKLDATGARPLKSQSLDSEASEAWEVYTLRNALEATVAEIAAHRIDEDGHRSFSRFSLA